MVHATDTSRATGVTGSDSDHDPAPAHTTAISDLRTKNDELAHELERLRGLASPRQPSYSVAPSTLKSTAPAAVPFSLNPTAR
jgi:hypothetical protein